jgi:isopentenyl phosphate kinase
MNLFGGCLAQKVNEENRKAKTEQHLIYCTESKMKEFDEHFVESLLEGVKQKSNG